MGKYEGSREVIKSDKRSNQIKGQYERYIGGYGARIKRLASPHPKKEKEENKTRDDDG